MCVISALNFLASSEREWLLWRSADADPEMIFLAGWASNIVEETLLRLRTEYASSQRIVIYDALVPFLTTPLNNDVYLQISSKMGVTAGASKVALHRLRQRFAQSLREVVEETVDDPQDVDAELSELFRVLVENPILPGGGLL